MASSPFDLLVVGAGAAGLMAACTAAKRGLSVGVVESGPVAGRKIRIAGGGRGNFTNRHIGPEHYAGADPAFVKPALRAFPPAATLALLDAYGIAYEEREHGQIFGCVPAVRLVDALVTDARTHGATFFFRHEVTALQRDKAVFLAHGIRPEGEVTLRGTHLLLAVGSPAWPDAGATDAGPRLLQSLSANGQHSSEPFRPALVPLIMPPRWPFAGLQGLSVTATLTLGSHKSARAFTLPLLFTHKGLSGPAALQMSNHWRPGTPLRLDFLPAASLKELMHAPENGAVPALTLLRRYLPQRLAEALHSHTMQCLHGASLFSPAVERGVAQWSKAQREVLCATVHAFDAEPLRTEGMRHAETTTGGVRTRDINPKTLESRSIPGLFLAGELLDIAGALGGYNLHWAFASGFVTGEWVSKNY